MAVALRVLDRAALATDPEAAELLRGAQGVRAAALGRAEPSLASELRHRGCTLLLLLTAAGPEEQDRVVGFLLADPPGIGVHLAELAVREDCRRRGFGGRLLREGLAALERGSPRKVSFFSLRVKPGSAARRLYLRHGFADDHVIPDYHGPGQDAVYMLRERDDA